MPRLVTVLLLSLLALPGCGGGGGDDGGKADRPARATPTATTGKQEAKPGGKEDVPTGPVTAAEKAVIRGWADALRHGDVERAASYWRVPAIAANGPAPFRLVTRRAVREFNASLACGARLESVERDKYLLLATFRLTDRRDRKGACASGVGHRARTLFGLSHGKIIQWIRASDPPSEGTLPDGTNS